MNARIPRHGLRSRVLHALNALALLVILASGLALGDWLPASLVNAVGGHEAIDGAHQNLGLAFDGAVFLAILCWWKSTLWLLRELAQLQRGELRWVWDYLRHLLAPRRHAAPGHAGYFDPLERRVLALLLLAVAITGISGVYLWWLPPAPTWLFIVMIRAHVAAAWSTLALLAVHIVAGLGVLPSHRGIARAMFGDGSVPLTTARRLWPAWAAKATDTTSAAHEQPDKTAR